MPLRNRNTHAARAPLTGQPLAGLKSRVDATGGFQGPEHQTRYEEKHDADRDLPGDEQIA